MMATKTKEQTYKRYRRGPNPRWPQRILAAYKGKRKGQWFVVARRLRWAASTATCLRSGRLVAPPGEWEFKSEKDTLLARRWR